MRSAHEERRTLCRDASYALLLWVYPMAKFPLGEIYIAPEAIHQLTTLGRTGEEFLRRHQEADWGDNTKIYRTSAAALARRSPTKPLLSFYQLVEKGGLVIATNPSRTHTAVSWRKVPADPQRKKPAQPLSATSPPERDYSS